MIEIHPKKIAGPWDDGYVLDVHTISSTMIGYNEYGHPEFDTVRSELGEAVYRLKYRFDKSVISSIVDTVAKFVSTWNARPNVVVPIPPSKAQRAFQPVVEIGSSLATNLEIEFDGRSLNKFRPTGQMKDVGDYSARVETLEAAIACEQGVARKRVLLLDDLYQSGATLNVSARALKEQGMAERVYVLALTRTRN